MIGTNALDGRGDEIVSVHFWTWSFDSNPSDLFGLSQLAGSLSEQATNLVIDFLQPPMD